MEENTENIKIAGVTLVTKDGKEIEIKDSIEVPVADIEVPQKVVEEKEVESDLVQEDDNQALKDGPIV